MLNNKSVAMRRNDQRCRLVWSLYILDSQTQNTLLQIGLLISLLVTNSNCGCPSYYR